MTNTGSGPSKSRVLFVDDDQAVLDGLRRTLRAYRRKWDMHFVADPRKALELSRREPPDVIVSDMRMPQMNGVDLLEKIRQSSPGTVRIILSGQSETSAIMKSVGPSHLFLSKPCAAEQIENAIRRACDLRVRLNGSGLLELVGGIETLPSLPAIYSELIEAIDAELPLTQIGEIICKDMAMTAKLLKIVNSSYFGLAREVVDPARAAVLLGVEMIQALVLGVKIFEQLDAKEIDSAEHQALWERTTGVAAISRQICLLENADDVLKNQTGVASLLHEIGLLILRMYRSEALDEAIGLMEAQEMSRPDAERAALGCTHGDVGAHLAALWGFPDPIVEAIAFHECPSTAASPGLTPLCIVHVAQAIAQADLAAADWMEAAPLDSAFLEESGASEHLGGWANAARELQSRARAE